MIADFLAVWNEAGHNRWRIAAVSAACTIGLFSLWLQEEHYGPQQPPKITYITTYEAGRSDAEIMRSNIANQKLQEQLSADQAQRDEHVRQLYKAVGRASGMDVDAIEAEARAENAPRKAAEREAKAKAAAAWKDDPQVRRLGAAATLGE